MLKKLCVRQKRLKTLQNAPNKHIMFHKPRRKSCGIVVAPTEYNEDTEVYQAHDHLSVGIAFPATWEFPVPLDLFLDFVVIKNSLMNHAAIL